MRCSSPVDWSMIVSLGSVLRNPADCQRSVIMDTRDKPGRKIHSWSPAVPVQSDPVVRRLCQPANRERVLARYRNCGRMRWNVHQPPPHESRRQGGLSGARLCRPDCRCGTKGLLPWRQEIQRVMAVGVNESWNNNDQ